MSLAPPSIDDTFCGPGAPVVTPDMPPLPTLWGLDPVALHDRFWSSQGVHVVRLGEHIEPLNGSELFLLTDWHMLSLFSLEDARAGLDASEATVVLLKVADARPGGYGEEIITDGQSRFVKFERVYDGAHRRYGRAVLTSDRRLARLWRGVADVRTGWRSIRAMALKRRPMREAIVGRLYSRHRIDETLRMAHDLVEWWSVPDVGTGIIRKLGPDVWGHTDCRIAPGTRLLGPLWIGSGRALADNQIVAGPAILWDALRPGEQGNVPVTRPAMAGRGAVTAAGFVAPRGRRDADDAQPGFDPWVRSRGFQRTKRAFDLLFAVVALGLTVPLYPFIMLAIAIEDGLPVFFGHRRETMGGREFSCLKFRTMHKDAERRKAQLKALNEVDGPQFFMENDPRLTRVGRLLRQLHIDELPQFWNVLLGQMSVVGPRPSPHCENQFCPPWREARLSVRPGITGLWQVQRSRRPGLDFQEWIRYDIEYVERANLWLDVRIIIKTLFRLISRARQPVRNGTPASSVNLRTPVIEVVSES